MTKVKNLASKSFLFVLFLLYILMLLNSPRVVNQLDIDITVGFFLNGSIAIIGILQEKSSYSLNKFHWYFVLIFMVLAPIENLIMNITHWGYSYNLDIVRYVNLLMLIWETVYFFSYKISHKIRIRRYTYSTRIYISKHEQIMLLFLSILSTIVMVLRCGFSNLFIRDAAVFGTGTFAILFDYLFRSTPALVSAIFILQRKKYKNISNALIFATLLMTLILNSPIALSRFWSGTVYLGLALIIIPENWIKGRRIDYIVIIGLLVIFPFFSYFKRFTLQQLFQQSIDINVFTVLSSDDFDAYSIFCKIVEYTQREGFTWGSQIRSVIFFFVPRAIVNIKGQPTGELVFNYFNAFFSNVSAPIMGEGYIDFGIFGVITYAFAFAKILKSFDEKFWNTKNSNEFTYYQIIEPFLLGMTIFIMRGALQPTFLRLMGFFLFLIIFYIVRRVLKHNVRRTQKYCFFS